MGFIIGGCLGFFLFFIYDLNSMKWQSKVLNPFFFIGCLLIVFSTSGAIYYFREDIVVKSTALVFWIPMSLIFLIFLIYTLFFALPFDSTYLTNEKGKQVHSKGMYALCRHPGVLWFIGLYFSLYFLLGNTTILLMAVVLSIMNIAYVIFQDFWTFPVIFNDYDHYVKSTPFLIPNSTSIRRMIRTIKSRTGE